MKSSPIRLKTYTGPNGGKQKLSPTARTAKQARDRKSSTARKSEKATAQVFRRKKTKSELRGKDVHHSSDGSMRLVSIAKNRGHRVS
tara:strand:- start:136 stop:396 length:261 start_codon:yes stop_codon:yes gene_type:complete